MEVKYLNDGNISDKKENEINEEITILSVREFCKSSFAKIENFFYENFSYSKLELYDEYYYITFVIPSLDVNSDSTTKFSLLLGSKELVFIDDTNLSLDIIGKLITVKKKFKSVLDIFSFFLSELIKDDYTKLESYEKTFAKLEIDILDEKIKNASREIVEIRNKLIEEEDYYEQIEDILLKLLSDDNGFYDNSNNDALNNCLTRIKRLNSHCKSLRDYGNQVRELYQTQVDIQLNKIMTILTVVSVICMPITLIAGWYGMNFKNMPELDYKFGYLIIIGITILLIIILIIIFKKKKYF
ncbi:MAG: hypothetical protein LBV58_02615 [Acholeplasmatales bacterium]|jgi:magnesium transporter|nr:hypothetical protein [Acholeplasmatales bacterium]